MAGRDALLNRNLGEQGATDFAQPDFFSKLLGRSPMAQFFIGFGSQKSGSTWLWSQLQNHPECDLPPYKEIHYFSRYPWYPTPSHLFLPWYLRVQEERRAWGPGRGFKSILKRLVKAKLSGNLKLFNYLCRYHFETQINDQWYLDLFRDYSDSVTGEITPAYALLSSNDIERIVSLVPGVKFIYIVRNPFEQALSALLHVRSKFSCYGGAHVKSSNSREQSELPHFLLSYFMSDMLSDRINHGAVLRRLLLAAGVDRVLVFNFESISHDPGTVATQVAEFLGISTSGFKAESLSKRVFPGDKSGIDYSQLPISHLLKVVEGHASSAPHEIKSYYDSWIEDFASKMQRSSH
jgi:hypothetical protein